VVRLVYLESTRPVWRIPSSLNARIRIQTGRGSDAPATAAGKDAFASRSPFSHNGSGAGAPASVPKGLGDCLGECLRFISASLAAAAWACTEWG